ncbi:hypothetical protein A2960_05240 [Candidatus Gottesmanbacteria bacterium RIFCSPLOWO2_01_FULL_39_12b]|uniref:Uncharacterized protein n=1 Tax=Candidatus Gottesmanbacteria bacterium RIFCSPLOWO2_01_FULL_39_12b TaxID=1798388 RepID=A0A1F6AM14_9BACT|nr:MAG: hypothetical protein A2960_05240 [Candidatus Gottesmanbacteria bacterium RIFCSPLOWO2_01_FULL_39_12b]
MTNNSSLPNRLIKENLIKNILILFLSVILYTPLLNSFRNIQEGELNIFFIIISLLLTAVCQANFSFTYEKSRIDILSTRLLSHVTTFIFMLLCALLLESMVITVGIIYPSLYTISFAFTVLLYLGIALFDFWDLLRNENKV